MPTLSPQFVFTDPGIRFLLPCSEFAFTFLFVVVAMAVVILAIVVISSNFFGLDNTNISMPILAN